MISTILVAIPTYLRLHRLERALESACVAAAAASHAVAVTIVVIDNDANRSAESVAKRFHATYVCEPIRGLSMVRNRALRIGRSYDAIAFFDDEWVSESWLVELIQAARHYSADVIQGPVKTILPPERPWRLKDPAMFRMNQKVEGERLANAYTGNVLIRTQCLEKLNHPEFSLRYNLAGGEDSEFFDRLHLLGARIVYTERAVAFEDVSPERFRLRSVARRAFTQGATVASARLEQRGVLHTLAYVTAMLGYSSSHLLRDLVMEQKLGGVPFKRFCHVAGTVTGLFGHFPERYKVVDSD